MAELNIGNDVKTIAFYLPQFHAIPENDRAWGKGFTEWVNTKKAVPLFDGHYQPKVPMNNNYYNLLDDAPKKWQSEIAKKYGIFGFCYYHYWFKDGKKLLEKPAEQMLANHEIDIPFCFSWANENWSKRWDGGEAELICEQNYGDVTDWRQHLDYLMDFFKDDRYITLNGKPLLLIYKPELIPNIDQMLDYWNAEMIKCGFPGICFMIQNTSWLYTPTYNLGKFDYQIKFQPFHAIVGQMKDINVLQKKQHIYKLLCSIGLRKLVNSIINSVKRRRTVDQSNNKQLVKLNYDDMWNWIIQNPSDSRQIECAYPDWDNTARKKNGFVHVGATPEKFKKYMSQLVAKVKKGQGPKLIFINAWNEWGEGAYLEPDEKNGFGYLEALQSAIKNEGVDTWLDSE